MKFSAYLVQVAVGCFCIATHALALELKCPATPADDSLTKNGSKARHNFDNYSQGEIGNDMIANLRGKPLSFYKAVVDNMIMAICDVEAKSERCVDESSLEAAKDWKESCIVTSDHVCPAAMCERTSNCYWNSVLPGENRTTRYPHDDYAKAADALWGIKSGSYARGIVNLMLPGLIISIVSILLWFVFFVGRYCCCCLWTSCRVCFLCSPIPNGDGYYICRQVVAPSLMYAFCLIAIAISGSLAFIGNEDINIAATNSFYQASGLLEDLGLFLDRSRLPLDNIQDIVQDAAVDARRIFNGTVYVKETALKIVSAFTDFGTIHVDGLGLSNAQTGFDAALEGFNRQVNPVVDEIQGMLDTLEMDLYSNVDMIQSAIVSAIDSVDSFNEQTVTWQDEIHRIEGQEFSTRKIRKLSIMGIFVFALTVTFAGFIGILASKRDRHHKMFHLLNIAGILCAILGSIAFVLASVGLSIGVLWHDACVITSIVTSDFEPLVGDKVATGANACFNDTNLAVAFNVTEKIDFQAKLDKGLAIVGEVNVTEKFGQVFNPLEDIQELIGKISTTSLRVLNKATALNTDTCPFNDTYNKNNIYEPWLANTDKDVTPWFLRPTGLTGGYSRLGTEDGTAYMSRIYDTTGVCSSTDSCCLNDDCNIIGSCNLGDDCLYPCSGVHSVIKTGYEATMQTFIIEQRITADLGVRCPTLKPYDVCPTPEFRSLGNEVTLVGLLGLYEKNISKTAVDLVNIANTSVGDTMDEVRDFLCNMNGSFVERRYDQVKSEMCDTMLGGFAQVNWALWLLAIFLEGAAILASVLSTRLQGMGRREASKRFSGNVGGDRITLTRAELYG